MGKQFDFDLTTAWKQLRAGVRKVILHGSGKVRFKFEWTREGAMWTSKGGGRKSARSPA